MKNIIVTLIALITVVLTMSVSVSADEWVKTEKGYKYQYDDGSYAKKGWLNIDGKKYYITKNGTRQTGWLEMKSGKKYYLKKDGSMVTGWFKADNGKYFFDKNGIMQTGYVINNKKIYKFKDNGLFEKQMMDCVLRIDDKNYYCLPSGNLAKGMVSNIPKGKDTKFDTAYFCDEGYSISCTKIIDGITYVFDKDKGLISKKYEFKVDTDSLSKLKSNDLLVSDYISLSNFKLTGNGSEVTLTGQVRIKRCKKVTVSLSGRIYDKNGKDVGGIVALPNDKKTYKAGDVINVNQTIKINNSKVYEFKFTDSNIWDLDSMTKRPDI